MNRRELESDDLLGKLSGKVAIVTASTEGIGLGIAESLAKHGASVMISSRKEANVEAAVAKLRADGHEVAGTVCHVGKPQDRQNLLKVRSSCGLSQLDIFPLQETVNRYGGLDILVSNAAVNPYFGELSSYQISG